MAFMTIAGQHPNDRIALSQALDDDRAETAGAPCYQNHQQILLKSRISLEATVAGPSWDGIRENPLFSRRPVLTGGFSLIPRLMGWLFCG